MTEPTRDDVARRTARHNIAAGLAMFVMGAFFFRKSFDISLDFVDEEGIGPRFFPQAIGVALGAIGVVMAVFGIKGRIAPADSSSLDAKRFLTDAVPLFLAGLAFVWMFGAFGYVAACFVLILAGLLVYGVREPWLMIALPAGMTAVLYLVFFKLMAVFEPEATIFNPLSLLGLT